MTDSADQKSIPHTHTPECSATILLYTMEGAGWSFLPSRFSWWLTSRFMGSQKEKRYLLTAQADIVHGSHTLLTLNFLMQIPWLTLFNECLQILVLF
jgi:hypothetical protein